MHTTKPSKCLLLSLSSLSGTTKTRQAGSESVAIHMLFLVSPVKKVKVSHSLIAVEEWMLEFHCILGTADERRSPSPPFAALSFPHSKRYSFTAGLTERVW